MVRAAVCVSRTWKSSRSGAVTAVPLGVTGLSLSVNVDDYSFR